MFIVSSDIGLFCSFFVIETYDLILQSAGSSCLLCDLLPLSRHPLLKNMVRGQNFISRVAVLVVMHGALLHSHAQQRICVDVWLQLLQCKACLAQSSWNSGKSDYGLYLHVIQFDQ